MIEVLDKFYGIKVFRSSKWVRKRPTKYRNTTVQTHFGTAGNLKSKEWMGELFYKEIVYFALVKLCVGIDFRTYSLLVFAIYLPKKKEILKSQIYIFTCLSSHYLSSKKQNREKKKEISFSFSSSKQNPFFSFFFGNT